MADPPDLSWIIPAFGGKRRSQMTAKEKVLKIDSQSFCNISFPTRIYLNCKPSSKKPTNYQIFSNSKAISHLQPRESWAWAEAYRNLIGKQK